MIRFKKILKLVIVIFPFILLIPAFLLKFEYITLDRMAQPLELFSDMDYSITPFGQSSSYNDNDTSFHFIPPSNAMPKNMEFYRLEQTEFAIAENKITNPIQPDSFVYERAKYLFQTYCIYCHGTSGKGDGPVITKVKLGTENEGFPKPPDLTMSQTKSKSDARLFHILSAGQNLMFPVSDRLSETDRWILVHYIRYLQSK